jgi:hypothetical protein
MSHRLRFTAKFPNEKAANEAKGHLLALIASLGGEVHARDLKVEKDKKK